VPYKNLADAAAWARDHPEQRREARRKWNKKNDALRSAMLNKLKAVPCADCGQRFPPECMDFDHVTGQKVTKVGLMRRHSVGAFLAEVAKCEVVCANCHRIRSRLHLAPKLREATRRERTA